MKKYLLIILVIVLALIAGFFAFRPTLDTSQINSVEEVAVPADFTAKFEIYTNGTKRVFTNAMYHNLSGDVFIESKDPSAIYIKKNGVTWNDFFRTLPFELSENCLVTGNGETYCTGEKGILNFYLNGQSSPNALNLQISPDDELIVRFE